MHRPFALALLAAGCAGLSPLGAQTTHPVQVSGASFTPRDVVIDAGDTIDWIWGVGNHNVVSGSSGAGDGNFSSGSPQVGPHTFSLTFSQAYLDAHPVPGNEYDYFCQLHAGLGMRGTVTVRNVASSTVRNGTGANPLGFVELSPPVLGGSWDTSVDLATPGHALSLLAISRSGPLSPLPLAGTLFGELLIEPPFLPIDVAAGLHSIPIPASDSLIARTIATQAATVGVGIVALNNAIDIEPGI